MYYIEIKISKLTWIMKQVPLLTEVRAKNRTMASVSWSRDHNVFFAITQSFHPIVPHEHLLF